MENAPSQRQENPLFVTWESLGEVEVPDAETLNVLRRSAKQMLDRRKPDIEDAAMAAAVRVELEERYTKTIGELDQLAISAGYDVDDPALNEVRSYIVPNPNDSISEAGFRYRRFSAEAMGGNDEAREDARDNLIAAIEGVRQFHAFEACLDSLAPASNPSLERAKNTILKYAYPLDMFVNNGMMPLRELSVANDLQITELLENTSSYLRVSDKITEQTNGNPSEAQREFLNQIMPLRQDEVADVQHYAVYDLGDDALGEYCDFIDKVPDFVKGLDGETLANLTDTEACADLVKMQASLDEVGHVLGDDNIGVSYNKELFASMLKDYDASNADVREYFANVYESASHMSSVAVQEYRSSLSATLGYLRENPCLTDEQRFRYASEITRLYSSDREKEWAARQAGQEAQRSKNNPETDQQSDEVLDVMGELARLFREEEPKEEKSVEPLVSQEAHQFEQYARLHLLDDSQIEGFRRMFARYENGDPETRILDLNDNSFGMRYGHYGISDFSVAAMVRPISPRNMQELIQGYRELPTSDQAKFSQNRVDALALQGVLFAGRDFIHDEHPDAHKILSALLAYHDADDAGRPQREAELRHIIAESGLNYGVGFDDYGSDLSRYEQPLDGTGESAIDVLRRLVRNTEPDPIEPPECNDIQLNKLLRDVDIFVGTDGTPKVEVSEIGDLIAYVNQKLQAETGQYSCDTSLVRALSYTERLATFAMRRVEEKDRRELFYDPTFKEIVKFRDLISSDDAFDSRKFEMFWSDFSNIPADADEEQISAQYGKLSMHIFEQLNKLAVRSSREHGGYSKRRIMALWSGNLNHELLGLVDSR